MAQKTHVQNKRETTAPFHMQEANGKSRIFAFRGKNKLDNLSNVVQTLQFNFTMVL